MADPVFQAGGGARGWSGADHGQRDRTERNTVFLNPGLYPESVVKNRRIGGGNHASIFQKKVATKYPLRHSRGSGNPGAVLRGIDGEFPFHPTPGFRVKPGMTKKLAQPVYRHPLWRE